MAETLKLRKIGLVEQVGDKIKSYIITGVWPIGTKIPSESELAEMFGVNRLTVRMALQKLNTLGIVQTRAGEGTYVIEFSFVEYINEVSDFLLKPEMLHDIFEFRKLIEVECMRLAIINYDEAEIRKLEQSLETLLKIINIKNTSNVMANLERYVEADLNFHYQIIKMSKNEVYYSMMIMMRDLLKKYFTTEYEKNWKEIHKADSFDEEGNMQREKDEHWNIVKAIKNRDYETAKIYYHYMLKESK